MSLRQDQTREIKPTAFKSHDESLLLAYCLDYHFEEYGTEFFTAGFNYKIPTPVAGSPIAEIIAKLGDVKFISLTNDIYSRTCENDPEDYRYEIFENYSSFGRIKRRIIARGVFGVVNGHVGTLEPQEDGSLLFKNKNKRVIKEFLVGPKKIYDKRVTDPDKKIGSTPEKDVMREFDLTSRIKELNVKRPVIIFPENSDPEQAIGPAYMAMKFVPGDTLENIVDAEHASLQFKMSTDRRIEISISTALALDRIHAKKITHRDMKPSNIMVNEFDSIDPVTILDCGLSKDSRIKDNARVGTPLYMAPETFDNDETTHQSDIYSAGCNLSELWRANRNRPANLRETILIARNRIFNNLFDGIDDLSDDHRKMISNLLHQMAAANPKKRPSLKYVVAIFEQIQLERKQASLNDADKKSLEMAVRAGTHLRTNLNRLKESCPMMEGIKRAPFKSFENEFSRALNSFQDTPFFVSAFVGRAKIKLINEMKSKQEIANKIDQVLEQYSSNYIKLQALQIKARNLLQELSSTSSPNKELMEKRLNRIIRKIGLVMEYPLERSLTIDNIALLGGKFEKYLLRFKPKVEEINTELSKGITQSMLTNSLAAQFNTPISTAQSLGKYGGSCINGTKKPSFVAAAPRPRL